MPEPLPSSASPRRSLPRTPAHARLRKAVRGLIRRSSTPPPVEAIAQRLRDRLVTSRGTDPWVHYRLVRPPLVGEPVREGPFPVGPFPMAPIADPATLAIRLGVSDGELRWLADPHGLASQRTTSLRHYRYRWVPKRSGSGHRLLEIPKPRLKRVQRCVLDEILAHIPVHPAAHGFVPGRTVRGHAAAHVGQHTVITLDLKSWFWHVTFARVFGVLRTAGLPRPVCELLAGLATAKTPPDVIRACPEAAHRPQHRTFEPGLLRGAHLAQGAPSSPALANAVAHRLDARLTGLATAVGGRYTRYADDLALSGGAAFGQMAPRVVSWVSRIVRDEGFRIHPHKTRIQRRGAAQRVCGVVVNEHVAASRADRERLEAMLVNAKRHGLSRLRSEGHVDPYAMLAGRVSWVEQLHPRHGAQLRALLAQVPQTDR